MKKRLFCLYLCLLFLLGVSFEGTSEAGVKLSGWKEMNPSLTPDGTDAKAGTYQYVLFGRYLQASDDVGGYLMQPIMWRVLSADQTGSNRKAFLLSDKNLDAMAFSNSSLNNNNYGLSPVRKFLVSDDTTGFYTPSSFTDAEKSLVAVQAFTTYDGDNNPTGGTLTADNAMFLLSSPDLMNPGYGFLSGDGTDVNRVALSTAYTASKAGGGSTGEARQYWMRSSFVPGTNKALDVIGGGALGSDPVFLEAAVRPACILNLESVIFKSASDPASSPTGAAGSISNPYLLHTQWTPASELTIEAGGKLKLTFPNAISSVDHWPDAVDFTVTTPSWTVIKTVEATEGDSYIILSPDVPVSSGAHVVLKYTVSADVNGTLTGGAIISRDSVGVTSAFGSEMWEINKLVTPPDVPDVPLSLTDLLTSLNRSLSPDMSVTPLTSTDAITKAPSGSFVITKKTAPTHTLDGYTNLLPSLVSTVTLTPSVTGNTLMLALALNVANRVTGFEIWVTLTDNERVALLNSSNVVLAYEFVSSWKTLVGAGGVLSWGDALSAGIVKFTVAGITFNYAVTDAVGSPFASGNMMIVPDGAKDNKLVDPVWLMKKKAETPVVETLKVTSFTVLPSPAVVGQTVSVKAVLNLKSTSAELTVRTSQGTTVKLTPQWSADGKTATTDYEPQTEGLYTVTVSAKLQTAQGTQTAQQESSLTVKPEEKAPVNGGSSGCNGMGLAGMLAGLTLIPTLRRR